MLFAHSLGRSLAWLCIVGVLGDHMNAGSGKTTAGVSSILSDKALQYAQRAAVDSGMEEPPLTKRETARQHGNFHKATGCGDCKFPEFHRARNSIILLQACVQKCCV